jgi:WD40 repeat protein
VRGILYVHPGEGQVNGCVAELYESRLDERVNLFLFHFLMFYPQVTEYSKTQIKEKTNPQEKKNIKTIDWNSNGQYLASGDTSIKVWMFDGNNIKRHIDIKCTIAILFS